MNAIMIIIGILVGLVLIYLLVLRPWHLRWGATDNDLAINLPSDSLVTNPDFSATRGITINFTPEEILKWIMQIGSRRAGWYSIDWMDNAGIKSSYEILSESQRIEIGQFIPSTPNQKNGIWVKEFKENEYILWVDKDGRAKRIWYLYPVDEKQSRLLARLTTK